MANNIFLLFCFILFGSQSFAQEDELFNRLPGVWEMQSGKITIIEKWRIESRRKLAGESYKIKGADTVLLEKVTIEPVKNVLNYIPVVSGQNKGKPVHFVLRPKPLGQFVFENRKHDYPQRIIYRFITDDSLHARNEGKKKGKMKGADYIYRRIQ